MLDSNTVILFISILIMLGFINTLKPVINFALIDITVFNRKDVYSGKLLSTLDILGFLDGLLFNLIIIPSLYSLIIVIKFIATAVPENGLITIENLIAIPSLINLFLFILISIKFKFESIFRGEGYLDVIFTKYLIRKDLKEDTPKDIINIIESFNMISFDYVSDSKEVVDTLKYQSYLFASEILKLNKNYENKINLYDFLRKPENSDKIKLLSEVILDTKVLRLIESDTYRFVKEKELCISQLNKLNLDMIAYVDNDPIKII